MKGMYMLTELFASLVTNYDNHHRKRNGESGGDGDAGGSLSSPLLLTEMSESYDSFEELKLELLQMMIFTVGSSGTSCMNGLILHFDDDPKLGPIRQHWQSCIATTHKHFVRCMVAQQQDFDRTLPKQPPCPV